MALWEQLHIASPTNMDIQVRATHNQTDRQVRLKALWDDVWSPQIRYASHLLSREPQLVQLNNHQQAVNILMTVMSTLKTTLKR